MFVKKTYCRCVIRGVRCGMCCVFALRVEGRVNKLDCPLYPVSGMVLFSCSPISLMVTLYGYCEGLAIPYLLVVFSDLVFGAYRIIPSVVVVPDSFRIVIFCVVFPYLFCPVLYY